MKSRLHPPSRAGIVRPSGGFTLVELLAVIAIISILLTIGAIGLGGMTGGKNVSSATTTTEALFAEARALATGKGTKARVLVDVNDPSDKDNYLRRIVVAYQEIDPATNQPKADSWILTAKPFQLPDRVFFSRVYSTREDGTQLPEFSLAAGENIKKQFAGKYVYYEFNSEGICSSPGSKFILGNGVRPGSTEPKTTPGSKRDFGGFVVWRSGSTSLVRNPDQAGIPNNVDKF